MAGARIHTTESPNPVALCEHTTEAESALATFVRPHDLVVASDTDERL